MELDLPNLEALQSEAAEFARGLRPNLEGATLITLSGDLGAGKTSFTQGIAKALGVIEPVTSPTFVLMKQYSLTNQAFSTLVHIDAYRLEGGAALTPLGFSDVCSNPQNLIVLEWPEKVADALGTPNHTITLFVTASGGRHLSYGN